MFCMARTHALIAERGISLVWLQRDGSPAPYYGAGLYAPEARFRIPAPTGSPRAEPVDWD